MEDESQLFLLIVDNQKMRATLIFVIFILLFSNVRAQNDLNLTLNITDIPENETKIFIAVYDNEKNFDRKANPLVSMVVEPEADTILVTFNNILMGVYAIAVFQDINNNGKLDTGMLKIPKEPFGISNYSSGIMFSAPSFHKAKIKINGDTTISIPLISIIKPSNKSE